MVSSSLDIFEFISKAKGRSNQDIIYMADQEATAAERLCLKQGVSEDIDNARHYALLLKDVVLYIRHGILTHSARQFNLENIKSGGQYH